MKIIRNRITFNCSEKEFDDIVMFVDELNILYNTNIIISKHTIDMWCKNDNE